MFPYDIKKQVVVGLSGASCSGKSWLAENFKKTYPELFCIFDLDSYYKDYDFVSKLEYTHDNPQSINFQEALNHLKLLKKNQTVSYSGYDFKSQNVSRKIVYKPAPIIIVEGIFVFFNQEFRSELDVKIWVNANEDLCYERRVRRDVKERGRTEKEAMFKYNNEALPGYHKYIAPLKTYADYVVENNQEESVGKEMSLEKLVSYI